MELNGTTVAELAEDELYIIRYLTKGRVAPDLTGMDSANQPLSLGQIEAQLIRNACQNFSVDSSLTTARLWAAELNGESDDSTFQSLAARAADAWRWAATITDPQTRAWAYNTVSVTHSDPPEAFKKEHAAALLAAGMK